MSQPSAGKEPFQIDEPHAPTESERALAGLGYASQVLLPVILPLVMLLTADTRRDAFLHYHAVHALALAVCSVLYELVVGIVVVVLGAVAPRAFALLWLLFLLPAIPLLAYGWHAHQGRTSEIPWLTGFLRTNRWL